MLTVSSDGVRRTFPPGRDVIVGRDVRADLRIPHPAISRAHMILRYHDGFWIAIDNSSRNGVFLGAQRIQSTAATDGLSINLGDPDGPRLTFELAVAPDNRTTAQTKRPVIAAPTQAITALRPRRRGPAAPHAVTVGRAPDNDIVVADMLASRHHARLLPTPSGTRIQDMRSINGTFVNGQRVKDTMLRENDVVTIGNIDLVFAGGTLVPRTAPATTTGGLEVHGVGVTLKRGAVTLLDRVSFTARPGTLTAVIGPSGSGKTTLLKTVVGLARPSSGSVSFDARDLHADYAALRSRIGMVPQHDVAHRGLTVAETLNFAAELRMPPDTSKTDRQQVVSRVLAELDMTAHADKRVDQLSGGQRKRVSVAMELLTEPSLLVLDEPTTGLDPALDRQVMTMLRRLADAGRVVVVVTHSLAFLSECDQVLLLAPGGKPAYCGPPEALGQVMGSTDWADIFTSLTTDPDGAQRRYLERHGAAAERSAPSVPFVNVGKPARTSLWRQFSALSRRQVRLLLNSRRYFVFLLALPVLVGLLPLTVGGSAGFGKPQPGTAAPMEPRQIIVLLSFGAILMGITLTVRDLINERPAYRHEQAAGLSASAYLLAKIVVFGAVATLQSVLLVMVVTAPVIGKPGPSTAAVLGSPMLELFVDVAATAVVAVILGLVVSSVCRSSDQYIPLLAVVCTAQLVLAGSVIPVTGRPVLEAIAALTPARWGVAAMASTIDLPNLVPAATDPIWAHSASRWLANMAMLAVLGLVFAAFVRWRLRLKAAA
ncbi:ATP-binding cassette domain-containing protein [Mycobacterium sp. 3519A]|uniref:ATP-binding cassette domain-containing protein n=1 Tax=Mycobacterium sp. 3519A TaxID=2057184 RepID=UPI000C7CD159|nr:ATP-binding cassette domain-containing protein [Mycobacterium sp. 3519A]